MNATRWVLMGLLGVLAIGGLPADSNAQGGGQGACGCSEQDKLDLENRIKLVKTAMQEYDALVKDWEAKEKHAGEQLLLDPESKDIIKAALEFKMSGMGDPNARSFGAVTDRNCDITVDPNATPCLRGALEDHEAVHRAACQTNKDKTPIYDILGKINWRLSQRVIDYMKEEKAGYQKELERLKEEQSKQEKNCKKLTKLDLSMQRQLQQAFAQRERLQGANNRLESYAKSLN